MGATKFSLWQDYNFFDLGICNFQKNCGKRAMCRNAQNEDPHYHQTNESGQNSGILNCQKKNTIS